MAYDRIPNLAPPAADGTALRGTIRAGHYAGTITGADAYEVNRYGYVRCLLFPFAIQTTGTAGVISPGTSMNFIQPTTAGGDHRVAVIPRAGSVISFWARLNATMSTGSFIVRPRWNGSFISTLRTVISASTTVLETGHQKVTDLSKDSSGATIPSNSALMCYYETAGRKGNPGTPNVSGADLVAGIIFEF